MSSGRVIGVVAFCTGISLLGGSTLAFAQDSQDAPAPEASAPASAPSEQQNQSSGVWRRFSGPARDQTPSNPAPNPEATVPRRLIMAAGTFLTVRTNERLSSDRNQAGDGFSATLEQPIVINGLVVAQRGQTVAGRIVEAQNAGRVKGVSRLGLQLTDLTLVDGQQVQIQSQLLGLTGRKSIGRDATAVAGTTGFGAAVGAASAGWHDRGEGAAIGAGAGALAATIGVLLTRGRATVVYPESVLTFRIETPVAISTEKAPQAFRYAAATDYSRNNSREGLRPPACAGYGCPPPPSPYYYGRYWSPLYPYGPYYAPYYYGPSFAFSYGPRFYHGPGFRFRR
jgi:hypothetical protein